LKKTPTIEVKTASLNDLVVKNNIEKIDFLSLDVEGYELQAIQGLFVKDNNFWFSNK
jgi:FkbM family methyltransferase